MSQRPRGGRRPPLVFAFALALPFAFALALAFVARPALGQTGREEAWPPPAGAEITLVGAEASLAPLREVLEELLSRGGVSVSWSRLDRLRPDEIFEAPGGRAGTASQVWIDVSSAAEARIYFRAAAGQRFVIRRLALPAGIGPVAVEEIAQIVQSVLRALGSGSGWALSRAEARVALAEPPPASLERPPGRSTRPPAVEIGAGAAGTLFAPEVPLTGRLDASIATLFPLGGAAAGASPGCLGGALVIGYGLPAHFRSGALGADLETASFRLGALWEPWREGRVTMRLGLAAGFDWVEFRPRAEQQGAAPAPAGAFFTPLGTLSAAVRLRVSAQLQLTMAALAEVSPERVHYDAVDAGGVLTEVLVPYRVRPGLSVAAELGL